MLNLSDLKLTEAAFEIRYDHAYILWDRAGTIWAKISLLWPDSKLQRIEPNLGTFTLGSKYVLSANIDRASIQDLKPSPSLNDFTEKADTFITTVIQTLGLKNFTRVGFRLVFAKTFTDRSEAANSMLSTGRILVPEGKQFNIEGQVLLPTYSLVYEGHSTAARILLQVQDKKIDFDPPPNVEELTPLHIEKPRLVYDVDYYTLAKVSTGQLRIKEWLSQAYHLIKRDSKSFLGGD